MASYSLPPFITYFDVGRVPDVLERVRVEHDQVGEFADLDRPEVLVGAKEARAVQAGDFQRAVIPERARAHPHFPVRGEAVMLAV